MFYFFPFWFCLFLSFFLLCCVLSELSSSRQGNTRTRGGESADTMYNFFVRQKIEKREKKKVRQTGRLSQPTFSLLYSVCMYVCMEAAGWI